MGRWQLIRPSVGRNLVTNPSFETNTNGWAGYATGTIDDVPPPSGSVGLIYGQRVGSVGLNAGSGDGVYYTIALTAGTLYYVRFKIGAFLAFTIKTAIIRTDTSAEVTSESVVLPRLPDNDYYFSEVDFSFTTPATTGFSLRITHTAGALGVFPYFLIDGVQISTYNTNYIDGDQFGCMWEGTPHNSISRNSLLYRGSSRAIGVSVDFEDDYHFYVEKVIDTGAHTPDWGISKRSAPRAGSVITSWRAPQRTVTLSGTICGASHANLNLLRNQMIHDTSPTLVPFVNGVPQPIRLQYVGTKTLELLVNYAGGLQKNFDDVKTYTDEVSLKLTAHDNPYWQEIGDTTSSLEIVDTLNMYGISARIAGLWSDLGIGSMSGTGEIYAIAWGPDGKLYFGGDFTGVNAIANTAYIARYNFSSGIVESLTATTIGGIVRALIFSPDNILYVGGDFTNVGTDANADYVVSYLDTLYGGSGTWAALVAANPLNGAVRAFAFDSNTGNLLIGGDFTTGSGGTLNYIASFDTAFNALGTGMNALVRAVAFLNDGRNTILAGGDFTDAGGAVVAYIAAYTTTDGWFAAGTLDDKVYSLVAYDDGAVVGGAFDTIDSEAAPRVLNLISITPDYVGWRVMTTSANATVYALTERNGIVYASLNTTYRSVTMWNGASWLIADMLVTAGAVIYAVAVNGYGEIACGGTGTVLAIAGSTTITLLTGAAETYPVITITHTEAESLQLHSIANEATQQGIYFSPANLLLPGETITIDCETLEVKSNFNRTLDTLPGSVPIRLIPGDNLITVFTIPGTTPISATGTASITYRPKYLSYDAVEGT